MLKRALCYKILPLLVKYALHTFIINLPFEISMEVDVIDWKLLGACNLKCLHCYGPEKTEEALPDEDLLKIAEKFGKLGAEWVVLTGGEPLLVPNIESLMEELSAQGMKIALSTNTTLFRKHQDTVERYVSSLNIPLDGSTPEVHASSRLDKKSFYTFFDILEHYMENPDSKPPLLRVGSVYSTATQGDFEAMARVLEPYADVIDTWKVYQIIDYEFQPERRLPLLGGQSSFTGEMSHLLGSTSLAQKITVAPATRRDQAYFMVNPRGQVVMPTDMDGRTVEVLIADILREPLENVVGKWRNHVQLSNYTENHEHYTRSGEQNSGSMHTTIGGLRDYL